MNATALTNSNGTSYDLGRVSASKQEVNISPNALRYVYRDKLGLRFFWVGKACFYSKSELATIIMRKGAAQPPARTAAQKAADAKKAEVAK